MVFIFKKKVLKFIFVVLCMVLVVIFTQSHRNHQVSRSIPTQSSNFKYNYDQDLMRYLNMWHQELFMSNKTVLQAYMKLLDYTHDLVIKEQWVPDLKVTKRPVSLKLQLNCKNEEYSLFLKENVRQKPAYVIDLILFGYELTFMEMRLYELYDVIDEFLLIETNLTFKYLPKPFFFMKNIDRFKGFLDKITYMTPFNITRFNNDGTIKSVINVRVEDTPAEFKRAFSLDEKQDQIQFLKFNYDVDERSRLLPIELYEKYIRKFTGNDLFLHGDIDEITDSNVLNHIKQCEIKNEYLPFAVWTTFFIYSYNYVFQSDLPAKGDPYSWLYPNILSIQNITKFKRIRLAGHDSQNALSRASGCHMNRFLRTFALGIYKGMSISDGSGLNRVYLDLIKSPSVESYEAYKSTVANARLEESFFHRVKKLSDLSQDYKTFLPWVVKYNKHAYSKFFI